MKRTKIFLAALIAAMTCMSFAGCGEVDSEPTVNDKVETTVETTMTDTTTESKSTTTTAASSTASTSKTDSKATTTTTAKPADDSSKADTSNADSKPDTAKTPDQPTDDPVEPVTQKPSTTAAVQPVTPNPKPETPTPAQHTHNWTPVYKTVDVYETRNKYEEKPVYETRDKYEEKPVYSEVPMYEEEQHMICDCGNDITNEYRNYQASGGTLSFSEWRHDVYWLKANGHKDHYGCTRTIWVTVQTGTEKVQTGTEKVKVGTEEVQVGTEKVKVGTEKVKTGTKQVIDHYECSCGATK